MTSMGSLRSKASSNWQDVAAGSSTLWRVYRLRLCVASLLANNQTSWDSRPGAIRGQLKVYLGL